MNDDLGAQLRRLATWADRVPPEHRRHVAQELLEDEHFVGVGPAARRGLRLGYELQS